MTTEGIRLADGDGERQWPLAVPRTLFTVYQPVIGGVAVLTWLNLYELSGRACEDPVGEVARRLNVSKPAIEDAVVDLERAGLITRQESSLVLHWPAQRVPVETGGAAAPGTNAPAPSEPPKAAPAAPVAASVSAPTPAAASHGPDEVAATAERGKWDADDAGLKAVVAFYHQRIGVMGPTQFEKLRFWMEEMGMSSDVVALAIEETVQNAKTPSINYLEGVLRNWYNQGVRTVADLQRSKQARASALPQRSEGASNASAYEHIDRDAVRRWKEMYADEYDG